LTKGSPSVPPAQASGGVFDTAFAARFEELLAWRRDVRRFRTDPLPDGLVERLLQAAHLAPSVGNSQPWRFVTVDDPARRDAVRESFRRANQEALASYSGESARLYATLKLEGLSLAPVQLAVFCDEETGQGAGLGRRSMPEMLAYSCVCAVNTLWLAARVRGVGLGWVSILEPEVVTTALDVPASWRLIAYLCMGYPAEEHLDPELERAGWQAGSGLDERWVRR
jgi:5,6-dimethylbenzimidazole synthase